jgi:hypothetical protein
LRWSSQPNQISKNGGGQPVECAKAVDNPTPPRGWSQIAALRRGGNRQGRRHVSNNLPTGYCSRRALGPQCAHERTQLDADGVSASVGGAWGVWCDLHWVWWQSACALNEGIALN